jgi:hypothetical protein
MSELLREIEEDIRAERMHRLWDKFGKTMIRISIAVLIGTAIGVVWKNYRHSQAMEQTSQLLTGMNIMAAGDYKAATQAFDAFSGQRSVYADMALLNKGKAEIALADNAAAAKTYGELATKSDANIFVSLGKLLAAKETDAPMAVSDDAPLLHLEKEARAWQWVKSGKKEEAVKLFSELSQDDKAPQSLRVRAAMAVTTLTPEKASGDGGIEK